MSRWLIGLGIALIVLGVLWPILTRLGMGRFPGDLVWERENIRIHFPFTTCLIISIVLSLLFWILRR